MPTFKVRVAQVYRTTRSIVVDVEADNGVSAVENVNSGSTDLPEWSDERWTEVWDLQNEEARLKGDQ